jgi:hypothetical protein
MTRAVNLASPVGLDAFANWYKFMEVALPQLRAADVVTCLQVIGPDHHGSSGLGAHGQIQRFGWSGGTWLLR